MSETETARPPKVEQDGGSQASAAQPKPEELAVLRQRVRDAAIAWGVRPGRPEDQFISAMLGTIEWSMRASQSAQDELKALVQKQADAGKVEYGKAEQLAKATNATLSQARSALINLQIEKENLATIMVEKTMPLFAEKMQKVLVKKVDDERSMLKLRRMVLSGLGAVAVFLAGYGLHAWEEGRTVASMESKAAAMESCLAHQLPGQGSGQGRFYCDVTTFREAVR